MSTIFLHNNLYYVCYFTDKLHIEHYYIKWTLCFSRNSEDNDDSYWYDHQTQSKHQQASLYPHNTYHGATQVHQRTPLSQADFKPIRFTDLPESGYVQMTGKPGPNKPIDRLLPTTSTSEAFSATTRRASNESNSEEEVRVEILSLKQFLTTLILH